MRPGSRAVAGVAGHPGAPCGLSVLDREATVVYRCTPAYRREYDGTQPWSDPDTGIEWALAEPVLIEKDTAAPRLADLPPGTPSAHTPRP
jgi:dTDP-4-dehydrorhamnose 3,5-epimerase